MKMKCFSWGVFGDEMTQGRGRKRGRRRSKREREKEQKLVKSDFWLASWLVGLLACWLNATSENVKQSLFRQDFLGLLV